MRNPLFRRHRRELVNNLGKYLGLFLMMTFAVSFTSGFLLAASSIETIVGDMKETYRIEDGRFSCDFEPEEEALNAVRDLGVTLHPDFYKQVDAALVGGDGADGITCRVYPARTQVNLPAIAQGRIPASDSEIALDRVFCENHGLVIGDVARLGDSEFAICGIVTLPDYQALFENNNSFMFNALTFGVAVLDPAGYERLGGKGEVYNYAFVFDDQGLTRDQRTDVEERMIEALSDHDAQLSDLIDAADNQGIGYALDDVQGDQTMWTVLLFLLVVIMGFVFVVLTSATIEQESAVLGTLLASGWRKHELVRHYMFLPGVIGLVASAVGLALGIGVLCDPFKNLYYHSYSLPPYHTIWNARIVLVTAVLPYLLLVSITLVGLLLNLRFTPLQFLRHEAAGRRSNFQLRLPERLRYVTRFRLRVLARNASHFVTLFFGIMFASLLLLFGLCMLPVVDNYAKALRETVAAPHQYVLKTPLELEGTDEQRSAYAAVLRLAQDRGRMDANRPAIDALKRLQDNKPLADAHRATAGQHRAHGCLGPAPGRCHARGCRQAIARQQGARRCGEAARVEAGAGGGGRASPIEAGSRRGCGAAADAAGRRGGGPSARGEAGHRRRRPASCRQARRHGGGPSVADPSRSCGRGATHGRRQRHASRLRAPLAG